MFILPHLKGLTAGNIGSAVFKNASLDLKFADNKSLINSISGQNLVTFTRASSGTYVDSQGVIRTATTNLQTNSENIASLGTLTGSTVTSNTIVAPDGQTTADKLIEDTSTGGHQVSGISISWLGNTTYTVSVYAKADTRTVLTVAFGTASNWVNSSRTAAFNLSNGTVSSTSGTPLVASIQALPNGWYRCVVSATTVAAPVASTLVLQLNNGSTTSYTGDGTSGLFLWGAQLEQSSTVGEYIPTTSTINSAPRFDHNPTTGESLGLLVEEARTNLSQQSDNFADVYWAKTDCTITSNESTAPDGTLTADLWTNTATPGVVQNNLTKDAAVRTYTGSLWVKSNVTVFTLSIDAGTTANRGRVVFNLSNGTLTSTLNDGAFTNTSGTITAYADNWYRLTVTTTTSTGTSIRLRAFFSNVGATARIWGAQVEEGAFATSYIPTTTATVTRSADVASITGSNFGTTRTNLVRNNTMVGAVAGSPGTPPTNGWVITNNATYTSSIIGTGIENGINYIDVQYVIAAGAAASGGIVYADTPVATASTAYTGSYYLKLVSGNSPQVRFVWQDGVSTINKTFFDLTSILTRYTDTVTTSVGANLARFAISFAASPSGATFVIRVGLPQIELGSVATAVIPTTNAAVTVFESSWYRQDEGTVRVQGQLIGGVAATFPNMVSITSATPNNDAITLPWTASSGLMRGGITSGGSASVDLAIGTAKQAGSLYTTSFAFSTVSANLAVDGAIATDDTTVTLPTVNQLLIGQPARFQPAANTTIKRLTYFPVRLANEVLQRITQ